MLAYPLRRLQTFASTAALQNSHEGSNCVVLNFAIPTGLDEDDNMDAKRESPEIIWVYNWFITAIGKLNKLKKEKLLYHKKQWKNTLQR